ncbi:DUF3857 domain-containing protein [Sphingobacteriales bacterium UPWRP_1]|nr:hypothetical protein BVG80_08685 [Sphingobacteriales bacterium TSM_CSM]PSJ78501.1 DUF3857 domain-containing protein [Sphingobacteriales bacterium UPWRP_1]
MKILIKLTGTFFCILLSSTLTAQKPPEKYGHIEVEDLKAIICPIDSNAHAYYLFDFGKSDFDFPDKKIMINEGTNKGFKVTFERHFRIKILNQAAFSEADIEFPVYRGAWGSDDVDFVKASTYNLENNAVVGSKLEKSAIIKEKVNENLTLYKFPMPNVKEGSIIEVNYAISSYITGNLQDWNFQHSIPALKSEYHVSIPEYYSFSMNMKGYANIEVKEQEGSQTLVLEVYERGSGSNIVRYDDAKYDYRYILYHFTGQNIPAFKEDGFLKTKDTYLSAVEFELQSYQFPGEAYRNFTNSWQTVITTLLNDGAFGEQIKKSVIPADDINLLRQKGATGTDLMHLTHKFITTKMRWNEKSQLFISNTLRDAYNKGTGNSAEINLCLLQMLRELGFDAYPVTLSTQEHGIINRVHPSINDFCYVVVAVTLDENMYLLDATEPSSGINLLPIRCLNDKGLLLRENAPLTWIDLQEKAVYKVQTLYNLSLDATDLGFKGSIDYNTSNYAAYIHNLQYSKNKTKENQIEYLQKENPGLNILGSEITTPDYSNYKMKEHYDVSVKNAAETAGDLIYFSPLFYETTSENPFKLQKRDYPVEFNFTYGIYNSVKLELPDNVTVEALPQSVSIILDTEKSAKFVYNVTQSGNTIQISSQLSIYKLLFLPEEYENLKDFYGQVVAKQNEKIVLKKN